MFEERHSCLFFIPVVLQKNSHLVMAVYESCVHLYPELSLEELPQEWGEDELFLPDPLHCLQNP